ncbi:MAG: hypothetical protein Q8K92_04145 [Leadbetterella sp.]|nr:hypothetical protein [Leadbetterella sp.]
MGQVLPGLSILVLLLLSSKRDKFSKSDAEKLAVYPADIDSLATL